ncbi:hypothetical protein MASR2M44_27480 [Bacteroidota bacterium]
MMKKGFLIPLLVVSLSIGACGDNGKPSVSEDLVSNPASANDTSTTAADQAPIMSFQENIHDFGKLKEGEVVTYKFKFTNTGNSDLIISNASASCGCTVPSFPKEPVAPGADGVIDVEFNSAGKSGVFDKTVSILANTVPTETILAIKGEVISASTPK